MWDDSKTPLERAAAEYAAAIAALIEAERAWVDAEKAKRDAWGVFGDAEVRTDHARRALLEAAAPGSTADGGGAATGPSPINEEG